MIKDPSRRVLDWGQVGKTRRFEECELRTVAHAEGGVQVRVLVSRRGNTIIDHST
jgi:hypothetical protein